MLFERSGPFFLAPQANFLAPRAIFLQRRRQDYLLIMNHLFILAAPQATFFSAAGFFSAPRANYPEPQAIFCSGAGKLLE